MPNKQHSDCLKALPGSPNSGCVTAADLDPLNHYRHPASSNHPLAARQPAVALVPDHDDAVRIACTAI